LSFRRRWGDNIKNDVERNYVLGHLARNKVKWPVLVKTIMNVWVYLKKKAWTILDHACGLLSKNSVECC
jgi:hypothetical protein